MGKKGYILAIDQGTTGSRVILFNHEGMVHSMAYRELRQIYPQPGWVEHDPVEIWTSVRDCMAQALKEGRVEPKEILGIGITNQRESTILWERDTGRPLYNSICWQCRRSAAICDELKAAGHEPAVTEKTGLVIDAYFSATKIKWLMDNVPEVRRQIERDNLCMGNIDSWLIWNLTGGSAHVTDFSNASRTMLLNIHKLAWDREIMGWLGIPEKILPKLLPSSGVMAHTSPDVFGAKVPIAGDAGDQHAATFGQACFHPGMAKNSYGTALAVFMNTGTALVRSKHGLTTDLGWRIGGQGGIRAGRGDLHRRSGHRVAEDRPGRHQRRRPGERPGREGAGHRRGLHGARIHGTLRPVLGHVRPGPDHRHHPRHGHRTPRP